MSAEPDDAPPTGLPKAASSPDLASLPAQSVLPPPPVRPPPLALPSLSPQPSPESSPRLVPSSPPYLSKNAVSFSEYVASELGGDPSLGVAFVPPGTAPGATAGTGPETGDGEEKKKIGHEPMFPTGGMGRYGKLACIQLDEGGGYLEREMTRGEILQEARETLGKWEPSPKAIGRFLSSAASPSAEMREFSRFLEPGMSGRKATQRVLRDYLRNSLQMRDIRQVDPAFVAKPALWVRHSALVVSLEGLRAIILYNKMFLFDAGSERTKQLMIVVRRRVVTNEEELAFEFRALEGVLIFLVMTLEGEFGGLKPEIEGVLKDLPAELTSKMLEELRAKKQQLNQFVVRASSVKGVLEGLLDDDEEMSNMYLTEKMHMHSYGCRETVDHSEVETLLEAYLQVIDELVNHSTLLNDAIDDTEDLVMIHLDTLRNRLLSVELALSVVSMTFGIGGVVAGVFGMNIQIPLFSSSASRLWFAFVVVAIISMVCLVSWLVLLALRKRGLYN